MNALIGNGTRYDLFNTDGRKRLVWRFRDEGVMVEDGALAVMRSSRWMRVPYSQITAVNLSAAVVGRSGTIGQCTLVLEDGRRVVITNGNDQGLADGRRDGPYRLTVQGQRVVDATRVLPMVLWLPAGVLAALGGTLVRRRRHR